MAPKKKGCRKRVSPNPLLPLNDGTDTAGCAVKMANACEVAEKLEALVEDVCKEEQNGNTDSQSTFPPEMPLGKAPKMEETSNSSRNEEKLVEEKMNESEEAADGASSGRRALRKRTVLKSTVSEKQVERKSTRTVKKTTGSSPVKDSSPANVKKKKTVEKVKKEVVNSSSAVEADSNGVVKSEVTEESIKTNVEKKKKIVEAKKRKARTGSKAETTEETVESSETVKRTKKVVIGISDAQAASAASVGAKVLKAAEGCKMVLGMHTSAAGSLEQSVYNALAVGCRSFALFVRNQRTWTCPPLSDDVVERFKEAVEKYSFPIHLIVPHASYLINPGSADPEKLLKSREAMLDECTRCERLGITMYNFHPGSTAGLCKPEECIRTIAESVNYIIERTKFITLVVETMAGQGHTVGGSFEEVRQIIDLVTNQDRVGVCIDTCHIFAAGYDIRAEEAYRETMEKFEKIVGFKFLRALHVNDSKGDLGSNLDRHENIGKGKIGMKGFSNFMNDSRLEGIPLVLETPAGKEPEEMIRLYKVIKK